MKRYWLMVICVLIGLSLIPASFVLAQGGNGEDPETLLEQSLARVAESGASPLSTNLFSSYMAGLTYPLIAGVDDVNIGAYEIDPVTNASNQLFTGAQAWGLAYDPTNNTVYIVSGSQLYSWPASGGTPTLIGTIQDPGGTTLSMVALAYYNGTFWSTRNIGTEGLYTINPTTAVATFVAPYSVPTANIDIGGMAFSPSGVLYATNDTATLPGGGRGLVQIALDGTVTFVAPYPAGETDIDGLAVGDDGRAYLIEDDPGASIHVYDFGTNAYVGTLNTPWATPETFSAGAWFPQGAPAITLDKTVGTDVNTCATTDEITVVAGSTVAYCYTVTNTGNITLTLHDLTDSALGTILTNFPFTLVPGASAFLTVSTPITVNTVNTALWTAYNPGPTDVVTATDVATVTVTIPPAPAIVLTKTVGLDASTCATTNSVTLPIGGADVTYCYMVENTGNVTFTTHTLVDDQLGTILSGVSQLLGPGDTYFMTVTVYVSQTVVNSATWTADDGQGNAASSSATATVTAQPTDVTLTELGAAATVPTLILVVSLLPLFLLGVVLRRRRAVTQ